MRDNEYRSRMSQWLKWGGIFVLLYPMILPGRLIGQKYPQGLIESSDPRTEVVFCHRLVHDWRLQVLLPGVEHYSIWLPKKKLHRGLVADWPGDPLRWVNEIYLDERESDQAILNKGLTCKGVTHVNSNCVEHEITRRQDEGRYGLTNHCQHPIVEILEKCRE